MRRKEGDCDAYRDGSVKQKEEDKGVEEVIEGGGEYGEKLLVDSIDCRW